MIFSHRAISSWGRAYAVKGWFMSLKTTFRPSAPSGWVMDCQISSPVKHSTGAMILVMVSRMKYSAVWAERRARPSFSSQYSRSLMISR